MSDAWRMAIQLDAKNGDFAGLERAMAAQSRAIGELVGQASIRLGIADRHPSLGDTNYKDRMSAWRSLDGAVEITMVYPGLPELSVIAAALGEVIAPMAEPGSIEIVAGPVFAMIPQREGECFLSLSFRRDPRMSGQQFSDWWRWEHAPLAIPLLGKNLFGYDQVHLRQEANQAISRSFQVDPVAYDAYDNLTFPDRHGFLEAVSDRASMARIFADEVGWIDDGSRRRAIMCRIA